MFPNLTGNLSSLLNTVPLPGKMTIIPFKEVGGLPLPIGLPYVTQINPDSFSENIQYQYNSLSPMGSSGSTQRFNKRRSPVFNFEFLIDGTGATGDKREVIAEVDTLKGILEINGEIHRPAFLLLVYGSFYAKCVLNSMQITYTMFRKNGTPLRAKVNCSFNGHITRMLDLLKLNLSSPDLTREHQVKEGDTLPLLSNAIYESPRFYIEVARANNLTNFRRIRVGQKIIFPPVKK